MVIGRVTTTWRSRKCQPRGISMPADAGALSMHICIWIAGPNGVSSRSQTIDNVSRLDVSWGRGTAGLIVDSAAPRDVGADASSEETAAGVGPRPRRAISTPGSRGTRTRTAEAGGGRGRRGVEDLASTAGAGCATASAGCDPGAMSRGRATNSAMTTEAVAHETAVPHPKKDPLCATSS
jgi:hypothetical protein